MDQKSVTSQKAISHEAAIMVVNIDCITFLSNSKSVFSEIKCVYLFERQSQRIIHYRGLDCRKCKILLNDDLMGNVFFDSWESILRTVILTVMAYAAMVFLLRISGKRTLTKMNAFDFVVTIALGSALATVSLNKNVTLADGSIAFALFIFLQASLTWLSVRSKKIKNIITSKPVMLLYKGEILDQTMKKERITLEELHMAARKKGILNLKQIGIIVLETTGDLTLIEELDTVRNETMQDVENYTN